MTRGPWLLSRSGSNACVTSSGPRVLVVNVHSTVPALTVGTDLSSFSRMPALLTSTSRWSTACGGSSACPSRRVPESPLGSQQCEDPPQRRCRLAGFGLRGRRASLGPRAGARPPARCPYWLLSPVRSVQSSCRAPGCPRGVRPDGGDTPTCSDVRRSSALAGIASRRLRCKASPGRLNRPFPTTMLQAAMVLRRRHCRPLL